MGSVRLVENLARLLDHLVLLLVVAVLRDGGVVGENVEGDLVRKHLVCHRGVGGIVRPGLGFSSSAMACAPAPLALW